MLAVLVGCAAVPPAWPADVAATLATARAAGSDVVVYFALPGRDQSDRMDREVLRSPVVLAALRRAQFHSLWLDGFTYHKLYAQWVGAGEGMGVVVLDGTGRPFAARPGPQDAGELAAFLDQVAAARAPVAAARQNAELAPSDGHAQYRLGVLLLELGCRVGTEELLVTAAQRGVLDAHHRLARLFALDGRVDRARQWLRTAVPSPARTVTEGYVLFKERRHRDAVHAFETALQAGVDGSERLRARLYLGKALHEAGSDDDARAVLVQLQQDAAGTTFAAAAQHTLSHFEDRHAHAH